MKQPGPQREHVENLVHRARYRLCSVVPLMMTAITPMVWSKTPGGKAGQEPRIEMVDRVGTEGTGKSFFFPIPTLGGGPCWADVRVGGGPDADHRIQYSIFYDNYRLLDARDRCVAWGTLDECERRMKSLGTVEMVEIVTPKLPASDDPNKAIKIDTKTATGAKAKVSDKEQVLILHGLGQSRHAMMPLARHLRDNGFDAWTVNYPSTMEKIETHADRLHQVINHLPAGAKLHLVGHSMGGLVVRSYLARHGSKRVSSVVMLGTPNQGAQRADAWMNHWLYRVVMGPAGQQLGRGDKGFIRTLPAKLDVPFGIMAGGTYTKRGFSRLIDGNDDGTVSVASTKMPGARDFIIMPVSHTWLADNIHCCRQVSHFLKHLRFHRRPKPGRRVAPTKSAPRDPVEIAPSKP